MLTNVKTSPPKRNKNVDDDAFVLIKKCIFKSAFVLAALDLMLFVTTPLAIKVRFC